MSFCWLLLACAAAPAGAGIVQQPDLPATAGAPAAVAAPGPAGPGMHLVTPPNVAIVLTFAAWVVLVRRRLAQSGRAS